MKILIINTVKFGLNGISSVIMNYYQNMDRRDMQFDFVANDFIDNQFRKIIESNGDRVILLQKRNHRPFRYITRLKKILFQTPYDIIHIHGNSAMMEIELSAIPPNYPAVRIVHAHNTQCTHVILHKMLYQKFIRSHDYALACSDAAGKWLYGGEEYTVFNNAIDTARFRFDEDIRRETRENLELKDRYVLLHIGNFNKQKNHGFLLDVFECLLKRQPASTLVLVGGGALFETIREKAKEKNLSDRIIFVGETHDVSPYLAAADVFVLPSKYEGLGIVNIEAQCSGLKCVVSDAVPAAANVTGSMDFLSLDDSPEDWAAHILHYAGGYERNDHAEEIAAGGYDIGQNAKKLRDFYETCAKTRRGA